MRCFLHMCRNIKAKLREFFMTSASSTVIVADIFGKRDGTNFLEGLVDASSVADFFSQLQGMEKKCNDIEVADSKQDPRFFSWF